MPGDPFSRFSRRGVPNSPPCITPERCVSYHRAVMDYVVIPEQIHMLICELGSFEDEIQPPAGFSAPSKRPKVKRLPGGAPDGSDNESQELKSLRLRH